jgi:hypothetical protein
MVIHGITRSARALRAGRRVFRLALFAGILQLLFTACSNPVTSGDPQPGVPDLPRFLRQDAGDPPVLVWSLNPGQTDLVDEVTIERKIIGQTDSSYVQVASVGGTISTWTDSSANPAEAYRYRIRASGPGGIGGWTRSDVPAYYNAVSATWPFSSQKYALITGLSIVWDASAEDDKQDLTIPRLLPVGGEGYLPVGGTADNSLSADADLRYAHLASCSIPWFSEEFPFQVGSRTFLGCAELASFGIASPEGVSLGGSAFYECSSLAVLELPDQVQFASRVFAYCTSLETLALPSGLQSLGIELFRGCTALSQITIPSGIDDIPQGCFDGCSGLTSVVFAPGSALSSVGKSAFNNCESLEWPQLPASVTSIGDMAFYRCFALDDAVLPAALESLGEMAFYDCDALTYMAVPGGVSVINRGTFQSCSNLGSITLPEGIESIGEYAFYDCETLPSIAIPASALSLGEAIFRDCIRLDSVTVHPSSPPSLGADAFTGCPATLAIEVPGASVAAYQAAAGWSAWSGRIVGM